MVVKFCFVSVFVAAVKFTADNDEMMRKRLEKPLFMSKCKKSC